MINRVDDLDEAWINFMNDGTLDLITNKSNDNNKLTIKILSKIVLILLFSESINL